MAQAKYVCSALVLMLLVHTSLFAQSEVLHSVTDAPVAADFSLMDIDGNKHTLSGYTGRVVILNFWATWCPPCRFELPSMEKAWIKLKQQGVVMLAINVGENADAIFTFTADYPMSFPLLLDSDSGVTQKYPVIGLPTTFVIDPRGRIVYRAIGAREWDQETLINQVLTLNNKPTQK
jgi:peroxiredoxin